MEHTCGVCFMPALSHESRCPCGCGDFFSPLCCEGCGCESYEDAHRAAEPDSDGKGIDG